MMNKRSALTGFLAVVLTGAALHAQNQSYDQFAPKPVPPAPLSAAEGPVANTNVAGSSDEILLPVLRGLVFVGQPEEVEARKAKTTPGIAFAAGLIVPAASAFRDLAAPYVGQPLTRGRLNTLITAIIVHYRTHDRPVVDVIVPEQDIAGGVVQILLLESRVGAVTVTGNRWFSDREIRGYFHVQPGNQISAATMRADLEWANQNPFHTSDVVYQPGAAVGTTDIVLQTQDRFPVRVYAGYEDSGNTQTGFDRYLAGFNWGDAWHAGLGQQLNYQYTTSADLRGLEAHSASYVIPLPWHHTLTLFGNYVTTQGQVPPYISLAGRSYQLSGRYTIPLRAIGDYKHTFGVGFDFRYNHNSLQFGDIPLTSIPVVVRQFVLTYDASLRDQRGVTSLSAQGYLSPGDWGSHNDDGTFGGSHTYATSKYDYVNLTLSRLTRLPHEWSLFLRGMLQVSDGNLVPSEQFGLGGYDTVRGYDEREVNRDEGYLYNVELRTPVMNLGSKLGLKKTSDQLQFLVFWEGGEGHNHTLLPNEPARTQLESVGGGLRYTIKTNLSIRADYGFQLKKSQIDQNHGHRGDLGVVLSY